ncbi:MAG TPA: hypothetical protein VIW27_08820 [Gammaproteobacteria bacterium]|jgi:hypothetical protein
MDRLRASQIHADDRTRIIAIESVHCRPGKFAGVYHLYAGIEPVALIVCTAGGNRLVSLTMADTDLDELQREIRGLRALLAWDQSNG